MRIEDLENVPAELLEIPQWVARRNKVPVDPKTGENAKVGDSEGSEKAQLSKKARDTWGTVNQAVSRAELDHLDGVGFVFPRTTRTTAWISTAAGTHTRVRSKSGLKGS